MTGFEYHDSSNRTVFAMLCSDTSDCSVGGKRGDFTRERRQQRPEIPRRVLRGIGRSQRVLDRTGRHGGSSREAADNKLATNMSNVWDGPSSSGWPATLVAG